MMKRTIAILLLAGGGFLASCSSHEAPAAPSKPATQTQNAPAKPPAPEPTPKPEDKQVAQQPTEPKPMPVTPAAPKADTPPPPPDYAKDWLITLDRAKELYDKKEVNGKQVIFVDARTFNEFREGHIRGAMCYSTKYTQGAPQPKLRNYLPGSAVVIYCHGELCTDSYQVGLYFQSLHMDIGPVFVIKDGFPGWKKSFPNLVDTGDEIGFN